MKQQRQRREKKSQNLEKKSLSTKLSYEEQKGITEVRPKLNYGRVLFIIIEFRMIT